MNNNKRGNLDQQRYDKRPETPNQAAPGKYISTEYLNYFAYQESRKHELTKINVNPNHVHMLPLGGVGEIGMNCMMYQYNGRWLMVDCGNSFDRLYSQLSHVVVPCVEFAKQRIDYFDGILLTHGHEDHIGALPYLWQQLDCAIYGTKFTNILVRRKFEEKGLPTDKIIDIECGYWQDIGTFQVRWIDVCHSIPGAAMIALRTEYGSILHTGDWKVDARPLLNEQTDFEAIKQLASEDLHAIVSDSTNIMVEGINPTEEEVGESLIDQITSIKHGKIFVTFFSTNISRLYSCIRAAKVGGRKIAILGRALQRSYESAIEAGYIEHQEHVLLEDFETIESDKLMIACSGSQGEDRSALTRIAKGKHKQITIHPGDTVFFSCRLIPTNAKEVVNLENALMKRGVNVITNADALIHSSGHAKRAEFEQFYALIKENAVRKIYSLPVHGTTMFLKRHAEFAKKHGFLSFNKDEVFNDGKLYRIAPDLEYLGEIEREVQFVDANKIVSTSSPLVQERRALQEGFLSVVVVVANGRNLIHTHVSSYGVDEDKNWLEYEVNQALKSLFHNMDVIQTSLTRMIRGRISYLLRNLLDKQVYIDLHIINNQHLRKR